MHWTPEYVMHGISYAALMLIIDALPTHEKSKKSEQKPLSMDDMRRMGINYMNEG
jgi:hypothetical protein